MADPLILQPATYYAVTARDNNPDCRNYEQVFNVPQFYSNDGIHYGVTCGRCGQQMELLTAVILDPQPEVS